MRNFLFQCQFFWFSNSTHNFVHFSCSKYDFLLFLMGLRSLLPHSYLLHYYYFNFSNLCAILTKFTQYWIFHKKYASFGVNFSTENGIFSTELVKWGNVLRSFFIFTNFFFSNTIFSTQNTKLSQKKGLVCRLVD